MTGDQFVAKHGNIANTYWAFMNTLKRLYNLKRGQVVTYNFLDKIIGK